MGDRNRGGYAYIKYYIVAGVWHIEYLGMYMHGMLSTKIIGMGQVLFI